MEDLQPISAAEQSAFCVEMLKRLNIQRQQGYLCDITLVMNDDGEFKAHRNVLSAASPFFCKLLESDMKENREGIIRFEEISGPVMEDVLEFIYTGTVEIIQEKAEELIAAGNYLIIPSLKTVSGRFLEGELSDSNCISTFYIAEKYDCEELICNSRKFIHENFATVGEMDEFLSLQTKEVARWISSDEIIVEAEASVFNIILKWVEHNKSERKAAFEELFRHVRLSFLSRDCLQDVVTNEIVRENLGCVKLVLDATFASEDDLPQSPRKGIGTNLCGSAQKPTGFGSTFSQPQTSGTSMLFGGKSTGSLFGGTAASTGNIFGLQQPTTQSSCGGTFGSAGGCLFVSTAKSTAGTSVFNTGQRNFGSKSTSGFGSSAGSTLFGSNANNGTGLFGTTQSGSSLFGKTSAMNTAAFGALGVSGNTGLGTPVKFSIVQGTDSLVKNGITTSISVRHQCITVMSNYDKKCLEELRIEDYEAGRKTGATGATSATAFFGPATSSASGGLFGNTTSTGFGTAQKTTTGFGCK